MLEFILFFAIGGGVSYCTIRFHNFKRFFIILLILALTYFTIFKRWNNFLSPYVLNNIAYIGTVFGAVLGSVLGFKDLDKSKI
tara:strand:- start:4547 stop:4795 length:249 start_codon:yes stop_codon:yes gene_type:complete